MKHLKFGNYREARTWTGDLPEALVSTACAAEITLPARNRSIPVTALAVEFSAGFTERSPYGLLGGTFTPANLSQLKVHIGSDSNGCRQIFSSPLRSSWEKVYVGLPQEYVKSVKDGLRSAQEWVDLPAGELTIDRGAHSETGSSSWLFRHLATVFLRLVSTPVKEMTDQGIVSAFEDGIPHSTL